MERPEIRKYIDINSVNSPSIHKLEEYIELLNDYCDFIEWRNTQLKLQNAFMKDKTKRLKKLEKALDKACECLEEGYGQEYASYEYFPDVDTMVKIPYHMNFKEWKEWCLKDE